LTIFEVLQRFSKEKRRWVCFNYFCFAQMWQWLIFRRIFLLQLFSLR